MSPHLLSYNVHASHLATNQPNDGLGPALVEGQGKGQSFLVLPLSGQQVNSLWGHKSTTINIPNAACL